MQITRLAECEEIIANDGCFLREFLHRDRDPVDQPYSLAWGAIDPGAHTLPHQLRNQSEAYWFVTGEGRMHIGEETETVRAGDTPRRRLGPSWL